MRSLILLVVLGACVRQPPPQSVASIPAGHPSEAALHGDRIHKAKERADRYWAEQDPEPAPAPRNFVCESFAAVNPKATCTPEMTDVGQYHMHSARVVIDQTLIRCVINDAAASVVCAPLIYSPPQEPAKDEPTPKKGKRK